MHRVLVIANNPNQASFRVRIAALAPLLAERGFHLDIHLRPKGWRKALHRSQLLQAAQNAHAVIIQRKLLDPWDAAALRRVARKLFYDIDDALMHHNRQVGLISRWRNQRRFAATLAAIDHVAAGNEYLADIFRQRGKAVTVIPTMVDCHRYSIKTHHSTPTPRLVWIGSNSTLPYLQQFLPVIERAERQIPGLRLLSIGDKPLLHASSWIEHEIWTQESEAASLCRGDIGIAPTPADQWTLGKCGFKILQYMATGLPAIASPVGANAQIVQEGVTGFSAQSTDDWINAITRLANDVNLRTAMGSAARQRAESLYSLAVAADQWAALLRDRIPPSPKQGPLERTIYSNDEK